MLGKLIKYDLRFGAKKYAFMAAMTAALLILSAIALIFRKELVTALFLVLAVIATIAFGIVYLVVSIQHLYKQLCSRESYLNYSLPVSPHSLILSKMISILIWGVATALIIVLFWGVAVNGMVAIQTGRSLISYWNEGLETVNNLSGIELSGVIAKTLIIGVIQFIMSICLAVFCVSLANVPYLKERNWGVATGVIGFIVIYNVVNLIPTFIWWLVEKNGGIDIFSESVIEGVTVNGLITNLSWVSCIAYALFAVVFYFLSVRIVDKHRFIG